ncbi:hypothetical protein MRS44_007687 [Fusarium solani]|uniref:uncharacterized protein n=1 Tax=Fusarium solani TaxID=169388 RepID=UPI0032C4A101|nr:hypothetical protein MRS44_007687 [Fusarium solani]
MTPEQNMILEAMGLWLAQTEDEKNNQNAISFEPDLLDSGRDPVFEDVVSGGGCFAGHVERKPKRMIDAYPPPSPPPRISPRRITTRPRGNPTAKGTKRRGPAKSDASKSSPRVSPRRITLRPRGNPTVEGTKRRGPAKSNASKALTVNLPHIPIEVPIKTTIKMPIKTTIKTTIKTAIKTTIKMPIKTAIKTTIKMPIKTAIKTTIKMPIKMTIKMTIKMPIKMPIKMLIEMLIEIPITGKQGIRKSMTKLM